MAVLLVVLLATFKWQYASTSMSRTELVQTLVSGDLARGDVLGRAINESELFGSAIFSRPASGYIYSAFFFVPRSIAPFKGTGTAYEFTAQVLSTTSDGMNWGFGIGAIEEASLNVGLIPAGLILTLYGLGMGALDRLSLRFRSLTVPSRLAALWICGYHLPAILLLFGSMAAIGVALDALFSRPIAADGVAVGGPLSKPIGNRQTLSWGGLRTDRVRAHR